MKYPMTAREAIQFAAILEAVAKDPEARVDTRFENGTFSIQIDREDEWISEQGTIDTVYTRICEKGLLVRTVEEIIPEIKEELNL